MWYPCNKVLNKALLNSWKLFKLSDSSVVYRVDWRRFEFYYHPQHIEIPTTTYVVVYTPVDFRLYVMYCASCVMVAIQLERIISTNNLNLCYQLSRIPIRTHNTQSKGNARQPLKLLRWPCSQLFVKLDRTKVMCWRLENNFVGKLYKCI